MFFLHVRSSLQRLNSKALLRYPALGFSAFGGCGKALCMENVGDAFQTDTSNLHGWDFFSGSYGSPPADGVSSPATDGETNAFFSPARYPQDTGDGDSHESEWTSSEEEGPEGVRSELKRVQHPSSSPFRGHSKKTQKKTQYTRYTLKTQGKWYDRHIQFDDAMTASFPVLAAKGGKVFHREWLQIEQLPNNDPEWEYCCGPDGPVDYHKYVFPKQHSNNRQLAFCKFCSVIDEDAPPVGFIRNKDDLKMFYPAPNYGLLETPKKVKSTNVFADGGIKEPLPSETTKVMFFKPGMFDQHARRFDHVERMQYVTDKFASRSGQISLGSLVVPPSPQRPPPGFDVRPKVVRQRTRLSDVSESMQQQNSVSASMHKQIQDELHTKGLFVNVYYLVMNAYPLSHFPSMCAADRAKGTPGFQHGVRGMGETSSYRGETYHMASNILECLSHVTQVSQLNSLKKANMISITSDESNDRVKDAKLTINLKWVEYQFDGEAKVRCEFFCLFELEGSSALDITNAIVMCLGPDLFPKLVNGSFDGCSTMMGAKTGLNANLQLLLPFFKSIHCCCHRGALASKEAANEDEHAAMLHKLLANMMAIFANSGLRGKKLQLFQTMVGEPNVKMKKLFAIRWLSSSQCMSTLVKSWVSLILTLKAILLKTGSGTEEAAKKAKRQDMLEKLCDISNIVSLHIHEKLLVDQANFTDKFQGRNAFVLGISDALHELRTQLKQVRYANTDLRVMDDATEQSESESEDESDCGIYFDQCDLDDLSMPLKALFEGLKLVHGEETLSMKSPCGKVTLTDLTMPGCSTSKWEKEMPRRARDNVIPYIQQLEESLDKWFPQAEFYQLFEIFDGRKMPQRTSPDFVAYGNDAIRDLGIFFQATNKKRVIAYPKVGDSVQILWAHRNGDDTRPNDTQKGTFYEATIEQDNQDGTYRVKYDDDDEDDWYADASEDALDEYLYHVPHLELYHLDDTNPPIDPRINLRDEWTKFKGAIVNACEADAHLRTHPFELVRHLLKLEQLRPVQLKRPGICFLLEFLLIWSASSAESEREFSVQNLIKTWSRCSLSHKNLDMLMRVYRLERLRWFAHVETNEKKEDQARMKEAIVSHMCERFWTGPNSLGERCLCKWRDRNVALSKMTNLTQLRAHATTIESIEMEEVEKIICSASDPVTELREFLKHA
jgi:hypothetical protein